MNLKENMFLFGIKVLNFYLKLNKIIYNGK